jgi:hypothetical protein
MNYSKTITSFGSWKKTRGKKMHGTNRENK